MDCGDIDRAPKVTVMECEQFHYDCWCLLEVARASHLLLLAVPGARQSRSGLARVTAHAHKAHTTVPACSSVRSECPSRRVRGDCADQWTAPVPPGSGLQAGIFPDVAATRPRHTRLLRLAPAPTTFESPDLLPGLCRCDMPAK